MSNRSASAGADMLEADLAFLALLADLVAVCAVARLVKSARANSETRIRTIRFLRFITSPWSLVLLRFLVTGGFGVRLAHEFSSLGLTVPASALVIDAAVGVYPDHAARPSRGNLWIGGCGTCRLGAGPFGRGRAGVRRGSHRAGRSGRGSRLRRTMASGRRV